MNLVLLFVLVATGFQFDGYGETGTTTTTDVRCVDLHIYIYMQEAEFDPSQDFSGA